MPETIRYSLISEQDIRFGTGTFEVTLSDGTVVLLNEVDIGNIMATVRGLKGYAKASLPTGGSLAGLLARLSDDIRGAWQYNGANWDPIYPVANVGDFSGATADIRLQAAIDALPSAGGIVDARALIGAQTISATVTLNKAVQLILGNATFSGTVDPLFALTVAGASIEGSVRSERTPLAGTIIAYTGSGNAIRLGVSAGGAGSAHTIKNLNINLSGSGTAANAIRSFGAFHSVFKNLNIQNVPTGGYALFIDVNTGSSIGAQHNLIEQIRSDGRLRLAGSGTNRVTTTKIDTTNFRLYEFSVCGNLILINTTAETSGITTGFDFNDVTDAVMLGCDIEGNATNGIALTSVSEFVALGLDFNGFTGTNRITGAPTALGMMIGRGYDLVVWGATGIEKLNLQSTPVWNDDVSGTTRRIIGRAAGPLVQVGDSGGWTALRLYGGGTNYVDVDTNGRFIPSSTDRNLGSSTAQWRLFGSVIATASLPAAGAGNDGTIIIEDGGAGDRNLIIYAGGQRFRIDGGAAF